MAIGSSKIGVLGGLVAGGTCTLNASGNFVVPPGVRCINIVARGGSGNPGNAGNAGNPGNPGFGAPGGLGRLTGGAGHTGAGVALRSYAKQFGCIFSQSTPSNNPNPIMSISFPQRPIGPGFGNRNLWTPLEGGPSPGSPWAAAGGSSRMWSGQQYVAGPATGSTGQSGVAGTAGTGGTAGNTGQQSTAFGCTFTGGAGGNAGVGGSAGTSGTGGTAGNPGAPSPGQYGRGNSGGPASSSAGGTGGNGAGNGGSGITNNCPIFNRQSVGICTICNPNFTSLNPPQGNSTYVTQVSFSVGGGGAAATNVGGNGSAFTSVGSTIFCTGHWGSTPSVLGHGGTDANASAGITPAQAANCPQANFARISCISTNTMGGHGGFSYGCTGGHAIINSGNPGIFATAQQIEQASGGVCLCGTGRFLAPTLGGTNPPFNYGPRTRTFDNCFSPQPATNNQNIWRAGGGGGAGGTNSSPPVNGWQACSPTKYGMLFSRGIFGVPSSAGGGGRGNAGNAGGGSPTPSGSVASPVTCNLIPVAPGATCPIVVGAPGGCVVICWNPQ